MPSVMVNTVEDHLIGVQQGLVPALVLVEGGESLGVGQVEGMFFAKAHAGM